MSLLMAVVVLAVILAVGYQIICMLGKSTDISGDIPDIGKIIHVLRLISVSGERVMIWECLPGVIKTTKIRGCFPGLDGVGNYLIGQDAETGIGFRKIGKI